MLEGMQTNCSSAGRELQCLVIWMNKFNRSWKSDKYCGYEWKTNKL